MKKLKGLLLALLIPGAALAVDYSELDKAQINLQAQYEATVLKAGTANELIRALNYKDHARIKNSLLEIEKFFKIYDTFNLGKIDFFMSQTRIDLRRKYTLNLPKLSSRKQKSLNSDLAAIDIHYNAYQARKKNIGKMDDYQRIESGRDFFNGAGNFSNKLREATGGKANRKWGNSLLPFIDNAKQLAPITDDFIQLLYSSYFRTKTKNPNETPIIDALRNVSQQIAKERKVKTKLYGLNNFKPMPLDGKTINILAFMHANSFFDTAVQGQINLEGLSSIANVDVIFPKFLAKRMVKSDHIITVGHGDILAKVENLARTKKLNKFFIAAEGLTPVGFYELRPLVDFFADSIYALLDKGLKVNVYPVSFPENFRFMNDYRRPIEGDKLVYGIVHPLLDSEDLTELRSMTNNRQSMAYMIRWIWFADLKSNTDLNIGMPKPTQMKKWLEGMLWGNL